MLVSVIIKRQCVFVTRGNVCIFWKLEGDISVSEGEKPSEFEWWDTPRARRKTFSIVSVAAREYGMRLKRSSYVFVTFGV